MIFLARLQEVCREIVNSLSYDAVKVFNEASYRDVFSLLCLARNGLQPATEVMSAFGRADLVVSAGDYLYVIEMKLVHREEDIAKKLEEAKKQIITRQYDVRLTTQKVVALALVINQYSVSEIIKHGTENAEDMQRQAIIVIEQVDIPKN